MLDNRIGLLFLIESLTVSFVMRGWLSDDDDDDPSHQLLRPSPVHQKGPNTKV